MRDFFNHVKRVATDDVKLYFAPFFAVGRAIRYLFKFIKDK
jgi:hypothetical protein